MNKLRNSLLKCSIITLNCILLGFSLIVGVHTIPTAWIKENVKESVKTFEREGVYFELQDTKNSMLDNFTDSLMIGVAAFSGHKGSLDDAMSNYRITVKDGNNIQALKAYVNNENVGFYSYGRYWHGYLVILKPLLLLFNYSEIRALNSIAQLILMMALVLGMHKRDMTRFCIPLMVSWYVMCPPAIMQSLQFSAIFYITFLSCLLIVNYHERIEVFGYVPFFLIVGACTSFFDLLTYPVLSIILPLTFVLIMRREKVDSFVSVTGNIVAYGASWGSGYGVMWASKWIIATVVTDANYILQSIDQMRWRTSNVASNGDALTATSGLEKCYELLQLPQNKVILVGSALLVLFILINNRKDFSCKLVSIYPFVFISCVPVVWLIVTCNHSFIHFWFTYRNLVATVFALYSGILAQIRCTSWDANKKQL